MRKGSPRKKGGTGKKKRGKKRANPREKSVFIKTHGARPNPGRSQSAKLLLKNLPLGVRGKRGKRRHIRGRALVLNRGKRANQKHNPWKGKLSSLRADIVGGEKGGSINQCRGTARVLQALEKIQTQVPTKSLDVNAGGENLGGGFRGVFANREKKRVRENVLGKQAQFPSPVGGHRPRYAWKKGTQICGKTGQGSGKESRRRGRKLTIKEERRTA